MRAHFNLPLQALHTFVTNIALRSFPIRHPTTRTPAASECCPYAKLLPGWSNPSRWKSTWPPSSVSRVRNFRSGCFLRLDPDGRSGALVPATERCEDQLHSRGQRRYSLENVSVKDVIVRRSASG